MGRPKEHTEATRAALLTAAEQLIERNGPDAASVRAVADAVGTTTRAVYSVFGSKDGMLEALATRLFELLAEAIDACSPTRDPVADVVSISLDGFRRTALDHPTLYALVFLRVMPDLRLGPEFANVAAQAYGRMEAHVARLDGHLGATSTRDAARAVHALTEGLASMELRGMLRNASEPEQLWRSSIEALLRGFARTAPAKKTARHRASGARPTSVS